MRTKLSFLILLIFVVNISFATYFKFEPHTVSQPDGTTIKCFISGDEYFN